jgi:hypothetical protein
MSSLPEPGAGGQVVSSLPQQGTDDQVVSSLPQQGTDNQVVSSLPEKGTDDKVVCLCQVKPTCKQLKKMAKSATYEYKALINELNKQIMTLKYEMAISERQVHINKLIKQKCAMEHEIDELSYLIDD